MSAGVSPVPDEAVEAMARVYYESQPRAKHSTASWAGLDELARQHFRSAARAALAAAIPSLHEGVMAEVSVQRDAALAANQHLRDEVARLQRELDDMGFFVDGMKTGAAALREGIAAEVLGPVRDRLLESEWQAGYVAGNNDAINGTTCGRRAAASAPVQVAEEVHAYAAAGYLVCGRQTGCSISRVDGYEGPARRSTTVDADVTCGDCRTWLDDMARVAAEEVSGDGN